MKEELEDGRLSFADAVHFVQQQPDQAAFAAVPVFGDNDETAEGARVFVLEADGAGGYHMRFVAGPFFSTAFAANEIMTPDEIPERARELRFMPTRLEEDWLAEQVQILIQKLMQASGRAAPQMPDYASAPVVAAGPEAVFPISFVGRRETP
ncbi:MAG: hypothetical protein Q7U97_06095 [Rhodocyclaceae bacterium]|jgi:hypothetical protein|nr:hypothetical protein [Rhodocyclaceae bacterium]